MSQQQPNFSNTLNDRPLKTIRLYGPLGVKFGRIHQLAVLNTREAIRALCAILPGFDRELMNSKDKGITYACFLGKKNLNSEETEYPAGAEDIRIAPMIQGAKRAGLFQTIVGAVLFAVSFFPGMQWLGPIGMGLMMGGVAQMLAPTPKGLSTKDSPENGASYNFNGPVNVTAQGNPVPLFYGEMFVGSATISAGLMSEDQI